MPSDRCPECGSYDRECANEKPVSGCGCARCLLAEVKRLRAKADGWSELCTNLEDRIDVALDWLSPWNDKVPINPASIAIEHAVKALKGGDGQ
jgi:hypothetical protein